MSLILADAEVDHLYGLLTTNADHWHDVAQTESDAYQRGYAKGQAKAYRRIAARLKQRETA